MVGGGGWLPALSPWAPWRRPGGRTPGRPVAAVGSASALAKHRPDRWPPSPGTVGPALCPGLKHKVARSGFASSCSCWSPCHLLVPSCDTVPPGFLPEIRGYMPWPPSGGKVPSSDVHLSVHVTESLPLPGGPAGPRDGTRCSFGEAEPKGGLGCAGLQLEWD